MGFRKYFTLGRGFDWQTFSNKFVILYFFATFSFYILYTLVFITQDPSDLVTYSGALSAAFLMFFGWAFAREFHPEDHLTSIVSAVVVSFAIVWFPAIWESNYMLLLLLLLSMRFINRSSGNIRVIWDFLIVSVVAIWTGYISESWVFTVIPAIALLIDGIFDSKSNNPTIFGALLTAVTMYFAYQYGVVRNVIYLAPLLEYFFVLMGILTFITVLLKRKVSGAVDDLGLEKVSGIRVLATRVFFIGMTLLILLYTGSFGYLMAMPGLLLFTVYPVIRFFNE